MVNEFIDGLKRDKARGNLAPHQIIFLLALFNIYAEKKSTSLNITDLIIEFQKVWEEHKSKFSSKNNKIGLPLKALINKGFIQIDTIDNISNFRKNKELEEKIRSIKIESVLKKFLEQENLSQILLNRIDN